MATEGRKVIYHCTDTDKPRDGDGLMQQESSMNAVADFQKCGAGQGELCCIFLVGGPAGAECARDGSLRDFLISKDMRAKRQPVKMFPACQDPDDGMPAKPPAS